MITRTLGTLALAAATGLVVAAPAQAQPTSGSFSVLSYNIAGLPAWLQDGDPETNIPIIGSRLGPYDIVHVQEDFNYHAALYEADDHPYRTLTSGGVPFGSGLNTVSHLPFSDLERHTWADCSVSSGDCLTPKGFTFTRVWLDEGVPVDLYNLHTDAGSESGDLAARRANLGQLSSAIQTHSAGNAVIVFGDTNTRYTRTGDTILEFAAENGLTDAWVELIRGGTPPAAGSDPLVCDDAAVTDDCEVVDKVLYRGSGYLTLTATAYQNDNAGFRNDAGEPLSDHYPIATEFAWSLNPEFRLSDQFGGPHGSHFTDHVPEGAQAAELSLRAGSRMDQIGLTLTDGTVLSHGGTGGTAAQLTLDADEYAASLYLCQGQHDGRTRIFFAEFTTSQGRTLAGGTATSDCTKFTAPDGWQIAGFHGRASRPPHPGQRRSPHTSRRSTRPASASTVSTAPPSATSGPPGTRPRDHREGRTQPDIGNLPPPTITCNPSHRQPDTSASTTPPYTHPSASSVTRTPGRVQRHHHQPVRRRDDRA